MMMMMMMMMIIIISMIITTTAKEDGNKYMHTKQRMETGMHRDQRVVMSDN